MARQKALKAGLIVKSKNHGDYEILDCYKDNNVLIRFVSTGYTTVTQYTNALRGNVKDYYFPRVSGVGFMGVGKYNSRKDSGVYAIWRQMIARCYSPETQKKQPTYIGCTVDSVWYDFQEFAKWYYAQSREVGVKYHIDKDLKVRGNRIYSPDYCQLVTASENLKDNRSTVSLISPDGDIVTHFGHVEFVERYGLSDSGVSELKSGKRKTHKGWRLAPAGDSADILKEGE